MALHEGAHTVDVVQKQHVAQLIQLIRADGRRERVLLEIADIVIARGEAGHTGTRERNLGRRGKNEDLIFRAVFNAEIVDIEQRIRCIGEVMQTIGVIPHDFEILCSRFQCGETADGLIRIRDTRGV